MLLLSWFLLHWRCDCWRHNRWRNCGWHYWRRNRWWDRWRDCCWCDCRRSLRRLLVWIICSIRISIFESNQCRNKNVYKSKRKFNLSSSTVKRGRQTGGASGSVNLWETCLKLKKKWEIYSPTVPHRLKSEDFSMFFPCLDI